MHASTLQAGEQGGSQEGQPCVPQMLLVEFYKGAPDLVRFQEPWSQEHSYLDKLKVRADCCREHLGCTRAA